MNRITTVLASLLFAGAALAAETATESAGEIKKIDKAQGKITLKHGEIKNLDMPPMTMVFRIKDAKQLDGLAVGDKVTFSAEQENGKIVVTQVVKAP